MDTAVAHWNAADLSTAQYTHAIAYADVTSVTRGCASAFDVLQHCSQEILVTRAMEGEL